jgi:hypothetical protein
MPYRRNSFILGGGFSAEARAAAITYFFDRAIELYGDQGSRLTQGERPIFWNIVA